MDTSNSTSRLGQPSRSVPPSLPYPSATAPSLQAFAQSSYPNSHLVHPIDEKADFHLHSQSHRPPSIPLPSPASHQSQFHYPQSSRASPSPFATYSRTTSSIAYSPPRGFRLANLLKPWIPIILYAATSLGFLAAISFWKTEVFQGLDELSRWLKSDEYTGYAAIFMLIFITTFPPVPLYSTLIILSGYTFGAWTGLVISYSASLAGALTVFTLSRSFLRASISRWLNCALTIKRVVRAIEKRPKLLFLIRLAPYPFNVMNCLLAASPTLTLRTYTICTALSLFKLIIHTSIGSSIRSFAEFHVAKPGQPAPHSDDENMLGHYSTIFGIVLCIAIFIYLSYVARKAVDDELEDDVLLARDSEETLAFLSDQDDSGRDMAQVQDMRPPSRADDRFVYSGLEELHIGL